MAKKVVWTRRATHSFRNVISYLENKWNYTVTKNFVVHTYDVIDLLAENPEIGTIEDISKNIRGFLVTKHNILFYRTTETEIILLNIYDTRSGPEKSKF